MAAYTLPCATVEPSDVPKIWLKRPGYDSSACSAPSSRHSPRPWLFTVARHLTRAMPFAVLEDSHAAGMIGLWPYGRPAQSPFDVVEASEAQRRATTVLASLPLAYREALLLVAVEGLRHSEAAEICGVTAEAMRQRVSRARALFARRLTDVECEASSLKEVTT